MVFRLIVKRSEERDSLDVVPMEMRDKDMRGNRAGVELAAKLLAEQAESGATVEHVQLVAHPHLDAGGIAPITQVFGLRSRSRAANSPEFHTHASPVKRFRPSSNAAVPVR